MFIITHVTDFPPAAERTRKYVLLPSEPDPILYIHSKKWSAPCATRLVRAASCAVVTSFARGVSRVGISKALEPGVPCVVGQSTSRGFTRWRISGRWMHGRRGVRKFLSPQSKTRCKTSEKHCACGLPSFTPSICERRCTI